MSSGDRKLRDAPGDEIDLLKIFGTLWGGKRWIIISLVIAACIGVFLVLRAQPIYQASALIQLETRKGSLALPTGMQELLGGDLSGSAAVETETQIIRSRMVIGEAVRKLDLQIVAEPVPFPILGKLPGRLGLPDFGLLSRYEWGNEHIRVSELEVPDAWLGKEMVLTITGEDSYTLQTPGDDVVEGRVGVRALLPGQPFSLIVQELNGPVDREFLVSRLSLGEAVKNTQEKFSVSSASRNASMLRMSFQDQVAANAERVLDAIADAYVAQNISRSAAEAENSLGFVEEQLPLAQRAVEEAQQALNAYRQQQQSVDVEYETRSLLEQATKIEADLNALSLQEDELKKKYTVNHPTYQLLLETRAALTRQLEDVRKATGDLPETQKEIFNLTRDLEVSQQVYIQLLNRSQELRVLRASTVGSVRIIDTAWSDGLKIAPRGSMIIAGALLVGMIVGIGIVFLRRMLHRGIRGAEEIERLGLSVFGTINHSPDAANNRQTRGNLTIHALEKPDDLVVEALRSLRTALHFGMLDAKTNSLMLTSSAPAAGKSFTTVNLAVVAAQAGQRVCLIDADLRRGYLRRYFHREKNTPGLSEYLSGEKTLEQVLIPGPVPGLSAILTGRFPPNPSELLMRAEFQTLLETLNEQFDLILIDTPPVLAVTDPVVIGRYVGGVIVVARHMVTAPGEIEAVLRTFETAGTKVTGAILNGYRQEEGSRYGGTYQYYNYRYSYQTEKE